MTSADDHLRLARHHLAEIDQHISAQRALLAQQRADGRQTAEGRRLLEALMEARVWALAHRRLAKQGLRRR